MKEDLSKENTEDSVEEKCVAAAAAIDESIKSGKADRILDYIMKCVEANKNNPGGTDSWVYMRVYDDCKEDVLKIIEKVRCKMQRRPSQFGVRTALRMVEDEVKKL